MGCGGDAGDGVVRGRGATSARGAFTPAAAGPEAFVRWVYGRYASDARFDNEAQYSRSLRILFARNSKLLGGEVGENNDGDEICQCQDWDKLRVLNVTTSAETPSRTSAEVRFVNGGQTEGVTLKLVLTPAGWRVDDVLHPRPGYSPSLRARLIDENRRLAAAAH